MTTALFCDSAGPWPPLWLFLFFVWEPWLHGVEDVPALVSKSEIRPTGGPGCFILSLFRNVM